MTSPLPMLLLPGMAADARIFQDQLARFPNLRVPSWIPRHPNESLREYAKRFAHAIDPGEPCIVGGASFGGIVALEVAAHLQAVACVLIGSIRSPAELSWRWRAMRPLAFLGPEGLRIAATITRHIPGFGRATMRRMERLSRPEAEFVRWAMCAVLRWQPSPAMQRVPIFQIHGEFDNTLPVRNSRADLIIPGGSHALSLFNPSAVNMYLERVLETFSPKG
ncbi:MAG: alpha/beta hydrolase [Gemmataceae bacterium]